MNDKDFLKLAEALKALAPYVEESRTMYEALTLLREIYNDNGGTYRYIQLT